MIPNPRKKSASQPDWVCNQDNYPCGQTVEKDGKTYYNPTASWNKKKFERPANLPKGTPMVHAPNGEDGYVPATEVRDPVAVAKQAEQDFIASMPPFLKPEPLITDDDDPQAEVWERKDRTSIAQTSLNCASTIYQGRDVDPDKLIVYAEKLYIWIVEKRA